MPFPIQNVLLWWNARKYYTVCGWEIYYACQSYLYAQDPKNPFLILLHMLLCCPDTTKSELLYSTLWYTVQYITVCNSDIPCYNNAAIWSIKIGCLEVKTHLVY